jgi:hypothetical protein
VGGFHQLKYDPDARFRSSLPANGTASWSEVKAKEASTTSKSARVSLSIGYENVDWDFLKTVYGWAAVQYQAWARGELVVHGNRTQHLLLHTDAIMEYWVDDFHYFGGDLYTFRKAPLVLHLTPGTHTIELRLWRDVRAFGGINEPTIDVLVELERTSDTLELAKPGILLSDTVNGRLASPYASVSLRNAGEDDVTIKSIMVSDNGFLSSKNRFLSGETPPLTVSKVRPSDPDNFGADLANLAGGQTRSLCFETSLSSVNSTSLNITISYTRSRDEPKTHTLHVSQSLTTQALHSPHKVTFLHPSGIVSYAMLRAPSANASCAFDNFLPVIIANHGAGLEADNPMVAHALDSVSDICAWVLYPTGVTPWSGDDWRR